MLFRSKDVPVISTSSAYRYEDDVPILIPGINDEQSELLEIQKKNRGWKGWIAPLPNCTTTGLVITMKPLYEKYGVKKDRKSTRLNSSHVVISYAVFCLKKKKSGITIHGLT